MGTILRNCLSYYWKTNTNPTTYNSISNGTRNRNVFEYMAKMKPREYQNVEYKSSWQAVEGGGKNNIPKKECKQLCPNSA